MDAERSYWSGRRVLICGVLSPLGAAVAETLAEHGADVSGIVGANVDPDSPYIDQRTYELVAPIRAKETNAAMLASILSASEIECVIDVTLDQPRTTHALLSACRVGVPQAAAVIGIPHFKSTLVSIGNRFRLEQLNPIGFAVMGESIHESVDRILAVAELTILHDQDTLTGIFDGQWLTRRVA
jgi:NAD(P)-dependent dehydrogenase (short-subunit alcohol dehydrogenase family)